MGARGPGSEESVRLRVRVIPRARRDEVAGRRGEAIMAVAWDALIEDEWRRSEATVRDDYDHLYGWVINV